MNHKPRLLYLAYCYPPLNVSGSVRARNTAVHLARLGWDVTVVTPDPSLWLPLDPLAVAETDAEIQREGLRRICTDHQWRCLNSNYLRQPESRLLWLLGSVCRRSARYLGIDPVVGWATPTYRACADLHPGDIDVVLATGDPYGSFPMAQRLAKRLRCPYVLDYRDLWTVGNPHRKDRRALSRPRRLEQRLLAGCAAAITVSDSWAAILRSTFGAGDKLHVISNGYSPEALQQVVPHDFGHIAIVYAGIFYPPLRVITPVMAALARLPATAGDSLPAWRFHYYGYGQDHVRDAAASYGLGKHVVLHGQVPRTETLAATKGAAVSVVVTSVAETATLPERGIITAKIFESMGLGTPVLAIAPAGSDLETVLQTAGKGRAFRGSDTDGIAAFLAELMAGKTFPANRPEQFAWPNLAKQLDATLRQAIEL
jgi:glycosyltransferase involved in cell wall biosynthesis